jgi:uncharacterized membrane protein
MGRRRRLGALSVPRRHRDGDVRGVASATARERGRRSARRAPPRLGFLFRLQAQLLGFGPIQNFFKVDMLNTMGLAMVAATWLWQVSADRRVRVPAFAAATTLITLATPLLRAAAWPAALPDPLEAYLRPAASFSAFPIFPWAGFLFAGVMAGDLVDRGRMKGRQDFLPVVFAAAGLTGVALGWLASYRPPLFPTADFWHDSPTIFFIRLGAVTTLLAVAWLVETALKPGPLFRALVVLGRSSLFVYWIHVEMVYGVIAEPIKRTLPLWQSLAGWAAMCVLLYGIVLVKNRLMAGRELPRPMRILAAVLR